MEFLDVGADAESTLAGACEDDNTNLVVLLKLEERLAQLGAQVKRYQIQGRVVESYERYIFSGLFNQNKFVLYSIILSPVI